MSLKKHSLRIMLFASLSSLVYTMKEFETPLLDKKSKKRAATMPAAKRESFQDFSNQKARLTADYLRAPEEEMYATPLTDSPHSEEEKSASNNQASPKNNDDDNDPLGLHLDSDPLDLSLHQKAPTATETAQEVNLDDLLPDDKAEEDTTVKPSTPVRSAQTTQTTTVALAPGEFSDAALKALNDLNEQVLKPISNDKDLRKEMIILLPHDQLSRIIDNIIKTKKISPKQQQELNLIEKNILFNLQRDTKDLFNEFMKKTTSKSAEDKVKRIKRYKTLLNRMLKITSSLQGPHVITEIRSITKLFSPRFNDSKDLQESTMKHLENSKDAIDLLDVAQKCAFTTIGLVVLIISGGEASDLFEEALDALLESDEDDKHEASTTVQPKSTTTVNIFGLSATTTTA